MSLRTLLLALATVAAACKPGNTSQTKSITGVDDATGKEASFGVFPLRRLYPTKPSAALQKSPILQQAEAIARNPYFALVECTGGNGASAGQMLDLVRARSEAGVGDLWLNGNGELVVSRDLAAHPLGNGAPDGAAAKTSCRALGRLMTWDVFAEIFRRYSRVPPDMKTAPGDKLATEGAFSAAMTLHLAVRGPFKKGAEGKLSTRFKALFDLAGWWRGDSGLAPAVLAKYFVANDAVFNPCVKPVGAQALYRDSLLRCAERPGAPGTFDYAPRDKAGYRLMRNQLEAAIVAAHDRLYAEGGNSDASLLALIDVTTRTGKVYLDGGTTGLRLADRAFVPAAAARFYGGATNYVPAASAGRPVAAAPASAVSARWVSDGRVIDTAKAAAIPSIGGRFDKDAYVKQYGDAGWQKACDAYGLDAKTVVGFNAFLEDKEKSQANAAGAKPAATAEGGAGAKPAATAEGGADTKPAATAEGGAGAKPAATSAGRDAESGAKPTAADGDAAAPANPATARVEAILPEPGTTAKLAAELPAAQPAPAVDKTPITPAEAKIQDLPLAERTAALGSLDPVTASKPIDAAAIDSARFANQRAAQSLRRQAAAEVDDPEKKAELLGNAAAEDAEYKRLSKLRGMDLTETEEVAQLKSKAEKIANGEAEGAQPVSGADLRADVERIKQLNLTDKEMAEVEGVGADLDKAGYKTDAPYLGVRTGDRLTNEFGVALNQAPGTGANAAKVNEIDPTDAEPGEKQIQAEQQGPAVTPTEGEPGEAEIAAGQRETPFNPTDGEPGEQEIRDEQQAGGFSPTDAEPGEDAVRSEQPAPQETDDQDQGDERETVGGPEGGDDTANI